MDRYIDLMKHAALLEHDAADKLIAEIDVHCAGFGFAHQAGVLRATVRTLIGRVAALHDELRHCAVHGACNGWIDENGRRLREQFGIDIEAEHAALEAGEESDTEPEEDEAEVIAGLNAEFVADQMRGMRRSS